MDISLYCSTPEQKIAADERPGPHQPFNQRRQATSTGSGDESDRTQSDGAQITRIIGNDANQAANNWG